MNRWQIQNLSSGVPLSTHGLFSLIAQSPASLKPRTSRFHVWGLGTTHGLSRVGRKQQGPSGAVHTSHVARGFNTSKPLSPPHEVGMMFMMLPLFPTHRVALQTK